MIESAYAAGQQEPSLIGFLLSNFYFSFDVLYTHKTSV